MLLPQSQAYKTLSDRLATVSSLHMNIELSNRNNQLKESSSSSSSTAIITNKKNQLFNELVDQFDQVQSKHTQFRLNLLSQRNMNIQQHKPNSATTFNMISSDNTATTGIDS